MVGKTLKWMESGMESQSSKEQTPKPSQNLEQRRSSTGTRVDAFFGDDLGRFVCSFGHGNRGLSPV